MSLSDDLSELNEVPWSGEQQADDNKGYVDKNSDVKSVIINDRMYLFQNIAPQTQQPVKIIDFSLRRVFPVQFLDFKPSTVRVNYSLSCFKFKVYFYGGLDENNQVLSTMDEFDASTYKFSLVKFRGDFKPKGRQGHCSVVVDQYNMFIFGGTY